MADKNEKRQQLIRERALALAVMHLTRRQDLKVAQADEDIGFDLRVRILRPEGGLRKFDIALRGAWPTVSDRRQLTFPIALTHRFGYRRRVVASVRMLPRTSLPQLRGYQPPRCLSCDVTGH